MRCIFLDESGELGFSDKSSRFFIISVLSCDEFSEIDISRIIKKVRKKILKKHLKETPEFKGHNSTDNIRIEVLTRLSKIKCEIFSIIIDKTKVYSYLKEKKHKLYNYLSNIILNECRLDSNKIKLIVDRSKNKRSLRDDFDNYIRNELNRKIDGCSIEIQHADSGNNSCLQVVDFISWAIFRKYESKDTRFYDIIKNKIITEKQLF